MPYYENNLYGAAEKPLSPWQLSLPAATVSPVRGASAEERVISVGGDGGGIAERPVRRNRRIPSPISSQMSTAPLCGPYGEEESNGLRSGADDVPQRRWMDERDLPQRSPVAPIAGLHSPRKHHAEEDFLSIPRAESSPSAPQVQARPSRGRAHAEVDAVAQGQEGIDRYLGEEGLVSSWPRPVAPDPRERPPFGTAVYRSAAKGDDGIAETVALPPRLAHESSQAAHQSHGVRGVHKHEGREGCRALSTGPEHQRPDGPLRADCAWCDYRLPEELAEYMQETSKYRSVPRPHCPECGAQLAPIVKDAREGNDSSGYHNLEEPPRLSPSRRRERLSKPATPPQRDRQERQSSSSESSGACVETADAASSCSDDSKHKTRPSWEAAPRSSRHMTETEKSMPPLLPRHPETPVPPPRAEARGGAEWKATENSAMVLAKTPYLTLDSLPRSLGTSALSPDGIAASWVVKGCVACSRQGGAGLAGLFCCCAMPCVLFRERRLLLLHKLRSRYICCAGAFPCCVPPVSLRPELYYTMGPAYLYSSAMGTSTAAATRPQQQQHRHGLYSVTSEGEGWVTASRLARGGQPPLAAFSSVKGVASPASLVSPQTGLPLDGCYSNWTAYRGDRPSARHATWSSSASVGTGCCDCVTCDDTPDAFDNSCDCRLYCVHPTACCLACPLCCLCCEVTYCMPCALWANRLLIRQHYHLTPDTAVDGGAVCCYTCCLQCCTCTCTEAYPSPTASAATRKCLHGTATRAAITAAAATSPPSLSCWFQLSTSVAACLAAVCCLCPCATCGLAQQRDQIQRLGYPLVVEVPPEMEMM
ncbi:hypothetical protein JIQ42_04783 [Leishmania sp. Namibia]|uniref:hypothetical protein n=1 Tax=Leishmania sp. Namibia TaxID=2802991 RepID=UPI001B436FAC|nr:hypothetical protein JIQ42_04783 [Leishmania sp. Namibia]